MSTVQRRRGDGDVRGEVAGREPGAAAREAFLREQAALGPACDFPGCKHYAIHGSRMCDLHLLVRLASNGSWVDDHHVDGGHG